MSENNSKYYSFVPLLNYAKSIDCPFIGIAGGKGNGKTYSIILWAIKEFLENGRCLRYLRRYVESIRPKAIKSLCRPHIQTLINLTGGKYNYFHYFQNRFYLARREGDKVVEKYPEPFIVCSALNGVEASTGADEGDCSAIFYDEFLSREKELDDEMYQLMIFQNNCIRNRTEHYTPTILVGNTVTRNSALAKDFGVDLYKMKQGDITVIKNKKGEPRIVFEYCSAVEIMTEAGDTYYNRFDDNDRIKMIYKGEWTLGDYPHIAKQRLTGSTFLCRFKIITPNDRAICFEFRQYSTSKVFGYVRVYDNDKLSKLCTLINKTQIFKYDTFNYLPQKGIFKKFIFLVFTKQVFFESCEVGEMFRDFLRTFKGCENISMVYK